MAIPQITMMTPPSADADSQTTQCCEQLEVSDQAASNCLLWCCVHHTRHVAGPLQNPSPQDLPTPNSQVRVQSFLGLINYLQPFIPSLSSKIMLLQEQLTKWDLNPLTDPAFQYLKAWICQTLLNATVVYYDRSKPLIVQTD